MVSGYRCRVATEVKQRIENVRAEIRSELADYLAGQRSYLTSIASELVPVCDALDEFFNEHKEKEYGDIISILTSKANE